MVIWILVTVQSYKTLKLKTPKIAKGAQEIPLYPPFSKGEF
jgi:hypothetical protein